MSRILIKTTRHLVMMRKKSTNSFFSFICLTFLESLSKNTIIISPRTTGHTSTIFTSPRASLREKDSLLRFIIKNVEIIYLISCSEQWLVVFTSIEFLLFSIKFFLYKNVLKRKRSRCDHSYISNWNLTCLQSVFFHSNLVT